MNYKNFFWGGAGEGERGDTEKFFRVIFFFFGLVVGNCPKLLHYSLFQNNYDLAISVVTDMYDTNFKWEDLKVQLGQFSTIVVSNYISIGKIIEIISELGKIIAKKLLIQN